MALSAALLRLAEHRWLAHDIRRLVLVLLVLVPMAVQVLTYYLDSVAIVSKNQLEAGVQMLLKSKNHESTAIILYLGAAAALVVLSGAEALAAPVCTSSAPCTLTFAQIYSGETFDLFDSDWGTLSSVTWQITVNPNGTMVFSKPGGGAVNVPATTPTTTLRYVFLGTEISAPATWNQLPAFTIPGGAKSVTESLTMSGAVTQSFSPSVLTPYIGTGTFGASSSSTSISFSNQTWVPPTGTNPVTVTANLTGAVTLSYDYMPPDDPEPSGVPEPASVLLLSCGLAALCWKRRS